MSDIIVKQVTNKKELKKFVKFVIKLYKGCPYYVPMIYGDEMKLLDKKSNGYIKHACEQALFLAYMDNKVVGRIQAIIPNDANKKSNQKRVRFSRFDCINNQEVANALFDAASEYGKSKGMTEIVGPLGFSDTEREGLLIEGFDQLGTYDEQYNYSYYQSLIENYGFVKDVDWIEFKLKIDENKSKEILKFYDRIMEHNKVHMVPKMSNKQLIKNYADAFFKMIDVCYDDLYGTYDFSKETKDHLLKSFSMFITYENWKGILDENNNLVGFAMWMPSISKPLLHTNGDIRNPITLIKLLHAIKHPKVFDFLLCGIDPKYQGKGLDIVYLKESYDLWHKYNLDHFETNLNLENNSAILAEWSRYEREQNKRRRAFVKPIINK